MHCAPRAAAVCTFAPGCAPVLQSLDCSRATLRFGLCEYEGLPNLCVFLPSVWEDWNSEDHEPGLVVFTCL